MEKKNKREIGGWFEETACRYLTENGLEILKRNFRVRQGEIDIVARDGKTLVFVEVKYRKDAAAGLPQEAVSVRKQKQISKVAVFYLSFAGLSIDTPCRFDVVAICGEEISWIKNAFCYVE